jgi:hypothetical protein
MVLPEPGTAINRGQRPTTWSGAADFRGCERVVPFLHVAALYLRRGNVTRACEAW